MLIPFWWVGTTTIAAEVNMEYKPQQMELVNVKAIKSGEKLLKLDAAQVVDVTGHKRKRQA